MLTIAQVDLFQAQLQTKMLEVALEQAKAELNDDRDCAKVHQCTYRFLSIYFAVFTNPLYNYTMAQTEAMILWISAVTSLNEVIPVSFTDFTVINTGTDHTHTISQIIGLQAILDDLQAQIDNIEATQITAIDGGNANAHDPDIPSTGILITIRNDSTQNWDEQDPTLSIGEMGFAIDGDVVTGIKIGLGKIWSETPYHISPFTPIITSTGRNLDDPKPPYNAQHNFQTEKEAWTYVLNPFSPPYITFPFPNIGGKYIQADAEVGDTYQGLMEGFGPPYYYDYTFNIFNAKSVFGEGTPPVRKYYVNDNFNTSFNITNTQADTVTQLHTAQLWANRGDSGLWKVFSAHVKSAKNPNDIRSESVYVRFRYLSVAFLWKANYSLLTHYTDTELSSIVNSMKNGQTGTKYPVMADGVGTVSFTTPTGPALVFDGAVFGGITPTPPAAEGPDGIETVFNIVIAAPAAAGTPFVHSPPTPDSPMKLSTARDFDYVHGTAHTPYRIWVVEKPIVGAMPVKIK